MENTPQPMSFSEFLDKIANKLSVFGILNALLVFSMTLENNNGSLMLISGCTTVNFVLLYIIGKESILYFNKLTEDKGQEVETPIKQIVYMFETIFFIFGLMFITLGLYAYFVNKYPTAFKLALIPFEMVFGILIVTIQLKYVAPIILKHTKNKITKTVVLILLTILSTFIAYFLFKAFIYMVI